MLINVNQLDSVGLTLFIQQASSGAAFSGNALNYLTNSGFIGPLAVWTSGGAQTVRGIKTFTSPIGVPYTGGTGDSVARLYVDQSISAASGVVNTSLIGASGVLSASLIATGAALSAVKVTGSSIISTVNFSGLGGTLVFTSGSFTFISGAAGGAGSSNTKVTGSAAIATPNFTGVGSVTLTYDGTYVRVSGAGSTDSSGYFETNFVHRGLVTESISGLKIFTGALGVGNPTATGHAVNLGYLTGVSGSLYTSITGMTGYNVYNTFNITGTGSITNNLSATGNMTNVFNVSGNITNVSTVNIGTITGNFVNMSFYFDQYSLVTGLNQVESFVSRDFIFTGYALGVINTGTQGFFSGGLYQRTATNTKVAVTQFSLNSGMFFSGRGDFNQTVSGMNRIGFDIYLIGTGITGLSVGIFGVGY